MICDEKKCTACGACVQVCPMHCIELEEIEGTRYPVVDKKKCVECNLCKQHCASIQGVQEHTILNAFASYAKNNHIRLTSASGGVFACMAKAVLEQGGIVFGSSMNSKLYIEHIMISKLSDLGKIQGSKYVYSDGKNCYMLAEQALKEGKKVLYSGTPCQIAGLYCFLQKDYDLLTTVDIICHGTPSYRLYRDYINDYQQLKKCTILKYKFRAHLENKEGYYGCVTYKNNKIRQRPLLWTCDSYYSYFMHGAIYRENCYSCPYAKNNRVGDVTLGDFWGVDKVISKKRAGNISLILTNTIKGNQIIKSNTDIELYSVKTSDAVKYNGQLNYPMKKPTELREQFYNLYAKGGWAAVRKDFYAKNQRVRMVSWIAYYTPDWIKKILHKVRKLLWM